MSLLQIFPLFMTLYMFPFLSQKNTLFRSKSIVNSKGMCEDYRDVFNMMTIYYIFIRIITCYLRLDLDVSYY
jgi:hypothetical protein